MRWPPTCVLGAAVAEPEAGLPDAEPSASSGPPTMMSVNTALFPRSSSKLDGTLRECCVRCVQRVHPAIMQYNSY